MLNTSQIMGVPEGWFSSRVMVAFFDGHAEGMTPGEYKNGGENLAINYSYAESPFGNVMVASTSKGICHIAFADSEAEGLTELQKVFPNAAYRPMVDLIQQNALYIFTQDWKKLTKIKST